NTPISRNTRAQVRVAGLNVKGRGGNNFRSQDNRWNEINRMLFDEKVGILAVGETHLTDEQIEEIEKIYERRIRIFNSIDIETPNKGGIAVVLNRELTNIDGVTVHRLIPGRAILLIIPWHKKRTLTVLAGYAPADSPAENKVYWDTLTDLWLHEDLPVPDIFIADSNLAPEPMDRLPTRKDADMATEAYARFKRILGLKDGWRVTNPDTRAYTYISPQGSHSRIDHILVSDDLFKHCTKWDISDVAVTTDHFMVSVRISAPGAPFIGEGRYAIPVHMTKDKLFMEYARKEGVKVNPEQVSDETTTLQSRFKEWKDKIQTFAQKR
ncbi:Endonuclease/exonuclease/phosphatase, partial [Favolaschia claudopus]